MKKANKAGGKSSQSNENHIKKHPIWRKSIILMVTIMSVGFMSCGGGDDDVKKESEVSLVGTWLLNLDSDCYLLLTFSQSGTVRIQEYDSGEWEEDEVYHYTFSNGILRITNENGKRA